MIFFRGRQFWQDLPPDIKNSDPLKVFKFDIERCGTTARYAKLKFPL